VIFESGINDGIFLAAMNFLASVIVGILAYKKIFKNFNNAVLISMLIRYLIVASLVWYEIGSNKSQAKEFGLAFMISTFIFILGEIFIFAYYSKISVLRK
jgi:hypothetical protein